jgi:DNA-directed RNA polymerase III subunit RPC6
MNRRKRELKKLETDQAKYLDRHRTKREQVRKSEELLQKRIVTQQKRREREKIRKQKERERERKRKARERAKSRPAKKRKTKG